MIRFRPVFQRHAVGYIFEFRLTPRHRFSLVAFQLYLGHVGAFLATLVLPRVFVQHNTEHIWLLALDRQRQLRAFWPAPFGVGYLARPMLPQRTMTAVNRVSIAKAKLKIIDHPLLLVQQSHRHHSRRPQRSLANASPVGYNPMDSTVKATPYHETYTDFL